MIFETTGYRMLKWICNTTGAVSTKALMVAFPLLSRLAIERCVLDLVNAGMVRFAAQDARATRTEIRLEITERGLQRLVEGESISC